ncbi:MAG TPA: hypothetical protein VIY30_18700, partial [Burkholderiaceae bacterium]
MAFAHHATDAVRLGREAARADGITARCLHFVGQTVRDLLAHGKGLVDPALQRMAAIHGRDRALQPIAARARRRAAQRHVGHRDAATHRQRQLLGEGNRP